MNIVTGLSATIFFCSLLFSSVNAQTFRQLVLYSDAIVQTTASDRKTVNTLRSDYYESETWQETERIEEWLKPVGGKNLPKTITTKDSLIVNFAKNDCPGVLGVIEQDELFYGIGFYKKEKDSYYQIAGMIVSPGKFTLLKKRIADLLTIQQEQDLHKKFTASVDWMLDEYEQTTAGDFLTSVKELDSGAVFRRYYEKMGVVKANANPLQPYQQQRLKELLTDTTKGTDALIVRSGMIPFFYKAYSAEVDAYLLRYIRQKMDNVNENKYEIEQAIEAFYAGNQQDKSIEPLVNDWYSFTDDDALAAQLESFLKEATQGKPHNSN